MRTARIVCASYSAAENCAAWFRRRNIKAVQSGDHVEVHFAQRRNGQFVPPEAQSTRARRRTLIAEATERYGTQPIVGDHDLNTNEMLVVDGDWTFQSGPDTGTQVAPNDGRTHTFWAEVFALDGLYDIRPVVLCHNDPDDVHRDCKYSDSPPVEDCEHVAKQYDVTNPLPCGGWNFDGQHVHPDEGCGVQWALDEVGPEIVGIDDSASPGKGFRAGHGFTVFHQEGCPVLVPVAPSTAE